MDGVPVRWLVARRDLGLGVLAGAAGLDRRATWAHSIELADPGPWLSGGELLLTTGLRLPSEPAGQRRYVEGLVRAEVAALGFGTGLTHDRVPPALVAAAEEAGLPLLQVPLPTPFVAVTRALMERLAELRYEDAVRAARSQPRMTRAALRGGPAAVVRELAVAAGGSALLFSPDGALTTAYPTAAATRAVGLAEDLAADRAESTVRTGPEGTAVAQLVRVGRRTHGRLVLFVERPLAATDHLLLGHAASLLALDAEKPPRLREERHRLNGLLLALLLDGAGLDAAGLLAEAGFPAVARVRVLAIAPPPGGDPRLLLAAAGARAEAEGVPRFGAVRGGLAVLLLPADDPDDAADAALAALVAAGGRAGLSDRHPPAGVRTAWHEARSAAAAGPGGLVRFDSLAGSRLAAEPAARAVLVELARSRLTPLAEHDAAHGTDLLASLRAFLEHHGQWEAAAGALGVHRHTLRTRIDRARAVLGTDLDSPHVRAELLMALTVWPPPPSPPPDGRDGP